MLHKYHLGTGRDVCSSILVLLLKRGVFAGNNVQERMLRASAEIKLHVGEAKLKYRFPRQRHLNKRRRTATFPRISFSMRPKHDCTNQPQSHQCCLLDGRGLGAINCKFGQANS
eukprot:symbB.v1.2.017138.t1/scaffold1268.1/size213459/19